MKIDVRGLSCPEPVVRTKKALESIKAGTISVITNSLTSKENIIRFAQNAGCMAHWAEKEKGVFEIEITKSGELSCQTKEYEQAIFIGSDTIGVGDEELGRLLMKLFLHTLTEAATKVKYLLLFMNNGVKLTWKVRKF